MESEKPAEPDHTKLVQGQEETVQKLKQRYEEKPSPALQRELLLETDRLLQLRAAATGDPRQRARDAAEAAKEEVLGRAVARVS